MCFKGKIETLKWIIKELLKTLSSKPSFFSSKRIKTMLAFISGETVLMYYFFYNIMKLQTIEAIAIATLFFSVAGFVLNKTEQSKEKYVANDGKES